MTVHSRKRSFSVVSVEPESDGTPSRNNGESKLVSFSPQKIKRCDSSADAAGLLLLLSKQSPGESTSEDQYPKQQLQLQLKQSHLPRHEADTEDFSAAFPLLPPPSFEGTTEKSCNRFQLQPLDVCILNFNDYTAKRQVPSIPSEEEKEQQEQENQQPQMIIGLAMGPPPRLPTLSAGYVLEPGM